MFSGAFPFFFPLDLAFADEVSPFVDAFDSVARRFSPARRVGVGVGRGVVGPGDETAFTITCTESAFAGVTGEGDWISLVDADVDACSGPGPLWLRTIGFTCAVDGTPVVEAALVVAAGGIGCGCGVKVGLSIGFAGTRAVDNFRSCCCPLSLSIACVEGAREEALTRG